MVDQNQVQNQSIQTYTTTQLRSIFNQYLEGLRRSGAETLPLGTGRGALEFFDLAVAKSESESVAKTTPTSPPHVVDIALAEVKETSPIYQPTTPSVKKEIGVKPKSAQPASGMPSQMEAENFRGLDLSAYPASLPWQQRNDYLATLESSVSVCIRCKELASCRNKVVFGTGNITPRLVFLGEAPGADEDRQGKPFVGAAGELLNKIIGACKMNRDEVYILNTIKCRPPGNRNPAPDELANCWEYTQRQLEILRPEFICCLGLIATKQLLKTGLPLGRLRQKFHQYRDSRVMATYHPAYLLRTESAKKHMWEDMKMLMKEMGRDLSN